MLLFLTFLFKSFNFFHFTEQIQVGNPIDECSSLKSISSEKSNSDINSVEEALLALDNVLADEDTTGQDDENDNDDDATIDAEDFIRQSLTDSFSSIENERLAVETPELRTIRIKEESTIFVDDLLKECQKILSDVENDEPLTQLPDTQLVTTNNELTVPSPSISNAKQNEIPGLENISSIECSSESSYLIDDKTIKIIIPTLNACKNDEMSETSEDADDSSIANNTVIDLTKFDKLSDISFESENCNSDSSNIKSEESFECLFTDGMSASTPMQKNKYIFPAQIDDDCAMIKMKLGFDITVEDDDIRTPVLEINNETKLIDQTFPVTEANCELKNVEDDKNVNCSNIQNNDKELNLLMELNETVVIKKDDNARSNETFVQDHQIEHETFVNDDENFLETTFVKKSDVKDDTFVVNNNFDFEPPEIKIDRDETNSEDMTTVTPVNTPIEVNYSIDTWDKIISSKAHASNALFDGNQPSTSSGNTGGWFLHPPGSSNGLNDETFEVEEDDENPENLNLAFEALRKQLAEVLPHAQVYRIYFWNI